jgi:serine/threonine-protein kinase RsbW
LGKTKYNKSFPSDPDLLPEIEDWIMEIAQEAKLNEDKFNLLALSVAEASSNSIMHGNKGDKNIPVDIEVIFDSEQIEITFSDRGSGFVVNEVPDPTAPENILKDNGRGIHIMKSFLDDLRYNFSDKGTDVTLVLKLN